MAIPLHALNPTQATPKTPPMGAIPEASRRDSSRGTTTMVLPDYAAIARETEKNRVSQQAASNGTTVLPEFTAQLDQMRGGQQRLESEVTQLREQNQQLIQHLLTTRQTQTAVPKEEEKPFYESLPEDLFSGFVVAGDTPGLGTIDSEKLKKAMIEVSKAAYNQARKDMQAVSTKSENDLRVQSFNYINHEIQKTNPDLADDHALIKQAWGVHANDENFKNSPSLAVAMNQIATTTRALKQGSTNGQAANAQSQETGTQAQPPVNGAAPQGQQVDERTALLQRLAQIDGVNNRSQTRTEAQPQPPNGESSSHVPFGGSNGYTRPGVQAQTDGQNVTVEGAENLTPLERHNMEENSRFNTNVALRNIDPNDSGSAPLGMKAAQVLLDKSEFAGQLKEEINEHGDKVAEYLRAD